MLYSLKKALKINLCKTQPTEESMKNKLAIYAKIPTLFFIFLVVSAVSPDRSSAGTIKLMGGVGFTTQILPLAGFDAVISHEGEKSSFLFLPAYKSELSLVYHNFSGSGQVSQGGVSGTTSVTFVAYELNYFMNFDINGMSVGPGIGYGVASTTDGSAPSSGSPLGDPSPFYTANDIHYGVLLLKASKRWSSIGCDMIANSFGGLIGGGLVCGIEF